jgi:hypothetical protein
MRQNLTSDSVERYIEASPELLYDIVSDVTRTPELSPEVVKCTWVKGATGPAVGARFRAINSAGRGPNWPNWPVVVAADRGREFAFSRTEPFAGTVEWRYRFTPEGTGTKVVESYTVTKPITIIGWFMIDTLSGLKDRAGDLRAGMTATLDRLAAIAEKQQVS